MTLDSSRRTQRRRTGGPRKGDLREIAILDAAERLLATVPYRDMTMDDVAREAGLSRPSLYFYFGSKEAVLTALHERTHGVMAQPVQVLRDGGASPEATMRAAIELLSRIWRAHAPALRTFHEVANSSPEFGARWTANLEHHVDALTELIERERAAGRAAPSPPAARSIASGWFWMLEHQFFALFSRRHTRAEEAELVDTVTALWFRCIGAPGAA
ncbi:MAG TPA: helix-turn-helix domain-containing protein [Acidimicrobiales bacterium]|nr:helix-turn-helix domain-containing protein [Acidimicrobiales bacterium]